MEVTAASELLEVATEWVWYGTGQGRQRRATGVGGEGDEGMTCPERI